MTSEIFNRQVYQGTIVNPDIGFEVGETVTISYWDEEGEIIEDLETYPEKKDYTICADTWGVWCGLSVSDLTADCVKNIRKVRDWRASNEITNPYLLP